ncbi:MAG: response regulator, partial [Gemmatimonadaceae bacterium]
MTERSDNAVSSRIAQLKREVDETSVRRVLVVDDEESIRRALATFLGASGYDVTTASSGEDALAAMKAGPKFSLMLCDIRMPGMSGVQLVPKVIEIDPDIAVMMLTAVDDASTATQVLSSGAMDYLIKPVELRDLERAIERILH